MQETIIIGGGLTGLTLGYFFEKDKKDFLILEKSPVAGGLMRSLTKGGFTFDIGGSHIIFSKDKEVLDFMLHLLGKNKGKNKRNTKVLYKGNFVKYPFENGLSDLPIEDNFECLNEFIKTCLERISGKLHQPENFQEWMYYNFGRGITEKYLLPYNRKIWKYEPKNMSLEWVSRIPQPPIEDIIKSSLGIETEGYTHQLYFYYPISGGIQEITNILEKKINDRILKQCDIKKIVKEDNFWIISTNKGEFRCKKLISTIPLQAISEVLELPKEILQAIKNLKYNSLVSIMLGIQNSKINDLSWLYIPDEKILTHRISFPSNYSDKNAPEGYSSVLAEITYNEGDDIDKTSDKELIQKTIKDLSKLGIIEEGAICFSEIERTKFAYVIYDLDYYKNTEIIREWFSRVGIDLVGRFSYYDYLNMDGCIRSVLEYVKILR